MKVVLYTLLIIGLMYVGICALIYFNQEQLIFHPQKLSADFKYNFPERFEEIKVRTPDGINMSGILFKADSSKGLIFYLHGNGGSIENWAAVADEYLKLQYDIFILDYRGYGKSEGNIISQEQFFSDAQLAYNDMKKRYDESKIVMLGYSIGTGTATYLASVNKPKMLILQAPYYNLTDMMRHYYKILPSVILKYKFETDKYIKACTMPVIIFHGDADEVIYYGSALKLEKLFKPQDTLITLKGQGHNGITDNAEYQVELRKLLQ